MNLQSLWEDMYQSGNWVPAWPEVLKDVTPELASWIPGPGAHSIWQEVNHVIFWRRVTLKKVHSDTSPSEDEVLEFEFASPANPTAEEWAKTLAELEETQNEILEHIKVNGNQMHRIPYHLIHDAYHLGRITQIRQMQGTQPPF